MAIPDGKPATDFSAMNREWVRTVATEAAESGSIGLPPVTADDNGKILGVVNGAWGAMDAGGGGSSDFSTAEVTVTLTDANAGFFGVCLINDGGDVFLSTACEMEESGTLMAVLYGDDPTIFETAFSEGASVAVSGGVTYSNGVFAVSGDGSITITSSK